MCCAWLPYLSGIALAATIFKYLLACTGFNYFNYISTITLPATVNQACVNRVSSDQAALFDPSNLMSSSSRHWAKDRPTYNSTLCDLGFIGNSDIYGLGVRSGLYIQWVSSLLANHLLREESTALISSYLIFHIALWVIIAILTFQKTCTFAVEIVLLYYLAYGGFFCVFTRPNLGDFEPAMMDPNWSNMVLLLYYLTMLTHVVWFIIIGRYSFPNMPCATTIFFFGPVQDAWMDVLAILMGPGLFGAVIILTVLTCVSCFIFAGQILESMRKSSIYQGLFSGIRYSPVVQLQSTTFRYLRVSKMLELSATQRENMRNKYGPYLSRYFSAYTMSRPFHCQHQRCILVFKGF